VLLYIGENKMSIANQKIHRLGSYLIRYGKFYVRFCRFHRRCICSTPE